jgi:DivIVA domain-containing protein
MAVRAETGSGDQGGGRGGSPIPAFHGALDTMLGSAPVFRSRMRGYDPAEVDTYVSWVESELGSVRRQVDDLLARFGACSAELEISRRLLADAPRGRVVFPVSERVEEMLQLAADEAAAMTENGAREAEHLLAEARSEADARLRKAHEIKETAVRAADELRDQARKQRAVAQSVLDRARAEAADVLRTAASERDRLGEEAAHERDRLAAAAAAERDRLAAVAAEERRRLDDEAAREREEAATTAAERLAGLQAEVADLRRQRDQAHQSLRGLSSRIGEALQAVAATVPDAVEPNIAAEGREYDPALVGSEASGGRPSADAPPGQRGAGDGVVRLRRPAAVSS